MSTPLFIQEPVLAAASHITTDLSSLSTQRRQFDYPSLTAGQGTCAVAEATLIEEIRYVVPAVNSSTGRLLILAQYNSVLADMSDGSTPYVVGEFQIAAGTSSTFASGRIALNFVLPPTWSLGWAADVRVSSSNVSLTLFAAGGIIR